MVLGFTPVLRFIPMVLCFHFSSFNMSMIFIKEVVLAYGEMGTSSGDRGGPGTVFVEDKTGLFSYQSRLYLDGKNLEKPKPVLIVLSGMDTNSPSCSSSSTAMTFSSIGR
jgi:hypothetical protein